MRRKHHWYAAHMLFGVILVAGSPAQAFHSTPTADAAHGERIYMQTCVACHGPDGRGSVSGTPDLTKSGGPLSKPDSVLLKNVRDGVRSEGASMMMPPRGGNPGLSVQDIKDVIAYLHELIAPVPE